MASKTTRPASAARGDTNRHDDGEAFIPDPKNGPGRIDDDDLPESLAEGFVKAATSGEAGDDDDVDAATAEEIGGPFVVTSPAEELAADADASNPPDATREPLPRATAAEPAPGRDADDIDDDALRAPSRERK
jgi:hypothetical protein